jgi:hypothetical protein
MAEREARLIRTETNSANDSEGVAFGLQGALFMPVFIAGIISIILLSVLVMNNTMSTPSAFGIASIPFAGTLFVVIAFLNDKPPHYLGDLFDILASGGQMSRHTYQPKHPLVKAREIAAKRNGKSS